MALAVYALPALRAIAVAGVLHRPRSLPVALNLFVFVIGLYLLTEKSLELALSLRSYDLSGLAIHTALVVKDASLVELLKNFLVGRQEVMW